MNAIIKFQSELFIDALKNLFKELNVPMNYIADEPTTAKDILKDTYKDNSTFKLVDEVFLLGMVDDAAFEGNESLSTDKIKSDYDGIIVFGITLHQRENNLLPTRSQLAEISRAFNREFYYTPVVLVFKYNDDNSKYIAFANTERLKYKQEWREGEKAGKVSLLRDVDIQNPHRGHIDIINQLRIPTIGIKSVDSFAKLYTFWQEIFSVNILNKKFYQELSNWYFWAVKQVTFPSKPTEIDAHNKNAKLEDLIQEHNARNVIRLLTRLLFTWFIKEKKLIPEDLFDLESLQKEILNNIEPFHEDGLFRQANQESVYYKAILQNLFFASLNCPIDSDGIDTRKRGFRGEGYGTHRGIDYLMRYKKHFKDPDAFLQMINNSVPFLNGGLFECLDEKYNNVYIDGFSDQMTKGELLIVPDFLFFGIEEQVDLSAEYGVSNNGTKNAAVKGLINILKSYKFTITENTPIEEDVALDPELLGKVFENLLASYNPETKTTARKQTGSFYTPREIVNYMVDESLIAYLKNAIVDWGIDESELDVKLHQLTSFDLKNPFEGNSKLINDIIFALDRCKILDPACGSGAFPMGILQKMVHILQKIDPENKVWKETQIQKVQEETNEVFKTIEDKSEREDKLKEINNAFDQRINDPDYARKLYLIENSIYGVDIQPIATQISKLRFFISLVVDQKSNNNRIKNFGIQPLPNLETKFVTANSLIDIEKETNLFTSLKVKELEKQLKHIRHKLFGARTKDTKLKYRQKDEELRTAIAKELNTQGLPIDSAEKLSKWDPYDQNASSNFFDPEWMFDIANGFDVIIGNPPYVRPRNEDVALLAYFRRNYKVAHNQFDLFHLFIELATRLLSDKGINSFIISNAFLANENTEKLRKFILDNVSLMKIIDIKEQVFEGASVDTVVYLMTKNKINESKSEYILITDIGFKTEHVFDQQLFYNNPRYNFTISLNSQLKEAFELIQRTPERVDNSFFVITGIKEYQVGKGNPPQKQSHKDNREFNSNSKIDETYIPEIRGKNLSPFSIKWDSEHIKYGPWLAEPRSINVFKGDKILVRKIPAKDRLVLAVLKEFFIADQSIYVGQFKTKMDFDEYYAVGVLSSILTHWFFKTFNNETDDLFPQIKTKQFKELPLKANRDFVNSISLLSQFLHIKNHQSLLNVLDALVFELYFSDHMKERDIDVLRFVEKDIIDIMQDNNFESLFNPEKEQIIELLHNKWTHPDNEVRNRIKLFAVRSPEILKPILES